MNEFFDGRLIVKVGDLTEEKTDAIVNAANSTLLGGGGVDGAIHDKGGPVIMAECRKLRESTLPAGLPTGDAVITTGGNLPAKYVIHTVGPIYGNHNGDEPKLLASCYESSVKIAVENDLRSIAFPSISTGAFRYPKPDAANVVWRSMRSLIEVYFDIEYRLVFHCESDSQIFLRNKV